MDSATKKLNTPLFLGSLSLLLLNDFIFKSTFNNWFTGKLSDFAGLFAFAFFWSVLFPKRIKFIHFITFFGFIFWKSSYSESIIQFINTFGFSFNRVVDYTDYIALTSVFFSYFYLKRDEIFYIKKLSAIPIIVMSCFAFIATSQPNYYHKIDYNKTYNFNYGVNELALRMNKIIDTEVNTAKSCSDSIQGFCYDSKSKCYYFNNAKYEKDSLGNLQESGIKNSSPFVCKIKSEDLMDNDSVQIRTFLGKFYIKGDSLKSSLYVEYLEQPFPVSISKKKQKKRLIKFLEENVLEKLQVE